MVDRGAAHPPARAAAGLARPSARAGEAGSITIWLLGVAVMILFVAGFAVDLWQATADRRALAGLADAAASAGSAALDEAAFRDRGEARLAPAEAERAAADLLTARAGEAGPEVADADVRATADRVVVTVRGEVETTLLRLLRPHADPWAVEVRAVAEPRVGTAG